MKEVPSQYGASQGSKGADFCFGLDGQYQGYPSTQSFCTKFGSECVI